MTLKNIYQFYYYQVSKEILSQQKIRHYMVLIEYIFRLLNRHS